MELNFSKTGNVWAAEFVAEGDFNVHIEKAEGFTSFYQRTAGGKYGYVRDLGNLSGDETIDFDFTALVYPKDIKIVCANKPVVGVVTFNA